jgi:Tfp pilus assembly protein FimV
MTRTLLSAALALLAACVVPVRAAVDAHLGNSPYCTVLVPQRLGALRKLELQAEKRAAGGSPSPELQRLREQSASMSAELEACRKAQRDTRTDMDHLDERKAAECMHNEASYSDQRLDAHLRRELLKWLKAEKCPGFEK